MDFVAIDVETAYSDMASICQIGIACYQAGTLVEEWVSYIDPEDFFDEINISIHGITESKVRRSPKLPGVAKTLYKLLDHKIVVCLTRFLPRFPSNGSVYYGRIENGRPDRTESCRFTLYSSNLCSARQVSHGKF